MSGAADALDKLLSVQQSVLRLREKRQGVLASNLANADTPNYKARDINFSAVLKQAKQKAVAPITLAVTSSAHISGSHPAHGANTLKSAGAGNDATVQYRQDQQGRIDGNNVDADYERMQFAENALRYEASVTLVSGQIRSMLAVIQN